MALRRYRAASNQTAFETASWIDAEARQVHPVFGTPSHFDIQKAKFQQRLPYHSLQEAIQRYRKDVKKANIFDDTESDELTWETIFDKAAVATQKYEADGKGVKGAPRRLGRKVGDYASAFQAWTRLVPDSSYTTAIRGGLNVIFTAAAETAKVRVVILDFFGDLPETIYHTQRLQKVHGKDEMLYIISLELNEALLYALEGTIKWLTESQHKKHLKSIFLSSSSSKPIEGLLQDVKRHTRRLEERVNELQALMIAEIHGNSQRERSELPVIRQSANLAAVNTTQILESLIGQHQQTSSQLERIERGIDCKNGLQGVLYSLTLGTAWARGLYEGSKQSIMATSTLFMDQEELFVALNVEEELLQQDLSSTHRQSHRMDALSQGGALWLMACPRFIDRFSSDRPSATFVERDCQSGSQDAFEKVSAFSVLAAMLTTTVRDVQPAQTLYFFCGKHTSSDDPLGGPNGLMRSLLAQLLLLYQFNLGFIDSRTPKEYLERHSLAQMTDTFSKLVRQLSRNTIIFIFIDGVSLLEKTEWIGDLRKVMYDLWELTWDDKIAATVKLVVTNPGRTHHLDGCVSSDDRVLVKPFPAVRGGGMTERSVKREMERLRQWHGITQESEPVTFLNHDSEEESDSEFELDWLSKKEPAGP